MNIKQNFKYHYFYKITNLINNHFYYGVHNTNNLDDGYMGSGRRLWYAYKKYGFENFKKEILKYFDSKEEAFKYESEIVNESLVKEDNCYNLSLGGKGGFIPNISDYVPKGLLKNKLCVKYKNTKEYFLIDVNDYDPNVYETTWTGRGHTEISKEKIRKTLTPNNSLNTHIWVNKEGIVKYLDKRKLDEYLNNGWKLGRMGYKPHKNSRGKKLGV